MCFPSDIQKQLFQILARVRITDSRAGFYRFYSNSRQKCKNSSKLLVFKRNTVLEVRKNPKPDSGVRFRICLAEWAGFEPACRSSRQHDFQSCSLRPLRYHSSFYRSNSIPYSLPFCNSFLDIFCFSISFFFSLFFLSFSVLFLYFFICFAISFIAFLILFSLSLIFSSILLSFSLIS